MLNGDSKCRIFKMCQGYLILNNVTFLNIKEVVSAKTPFIYVVCI
jgi:hypothetical protein